LETEIYSNGRHVWLIFSSGTGLNFQTKGYIYQVSVPQKRNVLLQLDFKIIKSLLSCHTTTTYRLDDDKNVFKKTTIKKTASVNTSSTYFVRISIGKKKCVLTSTRTWNEKSKYLLQETQTVYFRRRLKST